MTQAKRASFQIFPAKHGGFVITVNTLRPDTDDILFAGTLQACLSFLKRALEPKENENA